MRLSSIINRAVLFSAIFLQGHQLSAHEPSAHHDHEHDHGHVHVHGAAHLTIAFEQGVMILDFRAPADSIVGFESAAETPEQKAALETALVRLAQENTILDLTNTDCKRTSTEITTTGALASSSRDESAGGHADFITVLLLDCQANRLPAELRITAFSHFTGLETLDVQWIINGKQGAQAITATTSLLSW